MVKSVLILGGTISSTYFLRRISKHVDHIEIICNTHEPSSFSNLGKKIRYGSVAEVADVVLAWIKSKRDVCDSWLIVPCSELFVEFVPLFFEYGFDVFSSGSEFLNLFTNKKTFYAWLEKELGYSRLFFSIDDPLDFTGANKYIAKPIATSSRSNVNFKTKILSNKADLSQLQNELTPEQKKNVLVQVLHPDVQSLSYGSVWCHGIEVAHVIVRQIRQYPKGVSSSVDENVASEDIKKIREVVKSISKRFLLNGFIELEFIKSGDKVYPIDLNPRLWGWSNFIFHKFDGLSFGIFCDDKFDVAKKPDVTSWCFFLREIPAIFSDDNLSPLRKLVEARRAFAYSKVDCLCFSDIRPEFSSMIRKKLSHR